MLDINVMMGDGSFRQYGFTYNGHHDFETLKMLLRLKYGQSLKVIAITDTLLIIIKGAEVEFERELLESFLEKADQSISKWAAYGNGQIRRYASKVAKPVVEGEFMLRHAGSFDADMQAWNKLLGVSDDVRVMYEFVNEAGDRLYLYYHYSPTPMERTIRICSQITIVGFE